jgi:hypothetical protein
MAEIEVDRLDTILPESWNNIPHVVITAVQTIIKSV